MAKTGVKYRAYPEADQAVTLSRWIGAGRYMWNAKVADSKRLQKELGVGYTPDQTYSQFRDKEKEWMAEIPSIIYRNSVSKWMETVWKNRKGECGAPTFHRKKPREGVLLTDELFEFVRGEDGKMRLFIGTKKFPVGELVFKAHREFDIPRSVTVTRHNDKWYVSFCYEDGVPDDEILTKQEHLDYLRGLPRERLEEMTVGIDRGVKVPIMAGDQPFTQTEEARKRDSVLERKKKYYQRRMARQDRINKERIAEKKAEEKAEEKAQKALEKAQGKAEIAKIETPVVAPEKPKARERPEWISNRREKTKAKIAKMYEKQQNVRDDFAHKATRKIVDSDKSVFVMEHLRVKDMTKRAKSKKDENGQFIKNGAAAKSGLNNAILNVGWGKIETYLDYKSKKAGKVLLKVDPAYTSQECAHCGHTHPDNRKTQADFNCKGCGYTANADANAAAVIKKRAINLIQHSGVELSNKGVLVTAKVDTGRGGKSKTRAAKAVRAVSDEPSKNKTSARKDEASGFSRG